MSWKKLQAEGKVHVHKTSKKELDDLRAVIVRDLEDAAIQELSDDRRFATAYNAALQTAKMAIACAGYRLASTQGHHRLSLANCYFAHNSSGFPVLLRFYDAQFGLSFHPLHRHTGPVARTWRRPFPSCGVASPSGTIRIRLAALRFFYIKTLKKVWSIAETPYPKRVLRFPSILSQEEVTQLIDVGDGMQAKGTMRNTGSPSGDRGVDQLATRERQAGPYGMAERLVVPMKPGNSGGGKEPQLKGNARSNEGPRDWR